MELALGFAAFAALVALFFVAVLWAMPRAVHAARLDYTRGFCESVTVMALCLIAMTLIALAAPWN